MDYRQKFQELGINAQRSGKYICSKCSHTRKNKDDKCLSVQFKSDVVLYKCHNCGWQGAVSYDNRYTLNVKRDYKRPEPPKTMLDKEKVYKYFEGRGISKAVVDQYGIDYNGSEIVFPYYKAGELVNVKYRTHDKKFRQEAQTEKTFYGMDLITDFSRLVIVEGEIDVLSFAEIGIEAVSVPQGASENKLECIDNCWEFLQQFDCYVIATDNDEAGRKLENTLLSRLDKYKCKIARFYQDKDDANEVLKRDREELKQVISSAQFIKLEGVTDFLSNYDRIFEFWENGYTKGYSTGWKNLDEIFTIKTGYLMIVTGIPSRGKSFFVDNLLFNLSKQYGLKHLIASFENSLESHFARFASMDKEKKFKKGVSTLEELFESLEFFNEHIYRLETDRLWNIDSIIEQIEYMVKRFGIKTVVIDPYNRLDNTTTEREDKYIGGILAKLSMTAKRLDVLVIFIAHPRKLSINEKVPDMYSISGSGDWYNMADYGVIIHRERVGEQLENEMQVIVQKVKDFHLGNPSGGTAYLKYNSFRFKLFDKDNSVSGNIKGHFSSLIAEAGG